MIPNNIIPASYIARQFWCEMQVDLRRKYGDIKKPEKERGKEIHKDLLLEIGEVIPVKVKTPVDFLYFTLHNISVGIDRYNRDGITREFRIFFKFNSVTIRGIIDEIREVEEKGNKRIRIMETKTRSVNKRPSPAQIYGDKIQGMIYRYGLNSLISMNMKLEEIYDAFNVKPEEMSLSEEFIESSKISAELTSWETSKLLGVAIAGTFKEMIELPELSNRIELRYIYQKSGNEIYKEEYKFDPEYFGQKMRWALDYWLGRREPVPVGERNQWKCNFCGYKDKCPVVR
jgi:exonuclease V